MDSLYFFNKLYNWKCAWFILNFCIKCPTVCYRGMIQAGDIGLFDQLVAEDEYKAYELLTAKKLAAKKTRQPLPPAPKTTGKMEYKSRSWKTMESFHAPATIIPYFYSFFKFFLCI